MPVLFYRQQGVPIARGPAFHSTFLPDRVRIQIRNSELAVIPVGSTPVQPELILPQPGTLSCFLGSESSWQSGVPLFGATRYPGLYSDIDMIWSGQGRVLKSEFLVHPGGDPGQIRLRYEGLRSIKIDSDGSLLLETAEGAMREHPPEAYQSRDGAHHAVTVRYRLLDEQEIGFETDAYDPSFALWIDPLLSYSTYLGGSGNDVATAVAADSSGNMYIAGYTDSTDFPLASALQPVFGRSVDAFVAKFSAAGNQLIYATYLGGSLDDRATGLAIDSSGNVVVTGYTLSTNFPLAFPSQRSLAGGRDAFVTKINASGTGLVFSTFLGGTGVDAANAIAVDGSGNIYVAGETKSTDFPVLSGYQSLNKGLADAFVTKLSPTGTKLYSTYLGGAGDDRALAIAVDGSGAVYLGGSTTSPDFPTSNALQGSNAGGQDGFVSKLASTGNSLIFSTYFGGSGGLAGNPESVNALAIDSALNVYIAGSSPSTDLPTLSAFQTGIGGGGQDAFVAKLNPSGKPLAFSTYLGGLGIDSATALAVDSAGYLYVAGNTTSIDFPVRGATQAAKGASADAFLVQMTTTSPSIVFGSYLGGSGSDGANALAIANGNVYLSGQTTSTDFPRSGAYQNYGYTEGSAFLARYTFSGNPVNGTVTPASTSSLTQTFTFTFTHGAGFTTLANVWGLIQTSTSPQNACMWQYNTLKNELSLLDDGATRYLGPISPNSGATLQNSQCTIGGPGTTVSGSGNTLTVALPITASAFFGGSRNIYLYSRDLYGKQVGWDLKGAWTLAISGSPSFGAVSPASGTGTSATFTVPFKHSGGYGQLVAMYGLIAPTTNLTASCMWKYTQSTNSLWLLNDQASLYLGPISPSSGSTLQNSQCTIGGAGTLVTAAADTVSITLPITFAAGFGGTKSVYLYSSDTLNQAVGWTASGTWTVPGSSVPSVVSVTPSSGSGTLGTFSFVFKHTAGYTHLNYVYGFVQSSLNVAAACLWRYSPSSGTVWLLNDAGTSYGIPLSANSAGALQNSQCRIDTSAFTATGASDTLTVNAQISFKYAFGGLKNIYLDAIDISGQETGFFSKGTWTVPGGSAPSVVSVTPSSGTGSSGLFSYQFSDSGGASQLAGVWGLIAPQISLANSCMWKFVGTTNAFYLLDDSASIYLGPITAGANSTLQNSQCTLDGSLSSGSSSGTSLTVAVSLTFKAGFSGVKNQYLYAQDLNTSADGWTNKGTWTVP